VAPSATKKVARLRNDPRASFLVESGQQWAKLQAVHLTGTVEFVNSPHTQASIDNALDSKYQAFRAPRDTMPKSARQRYAERMFLRLVAHPRILSWDSQRLDVLADPARED